MRIIRGVKNLAEKFQDPVLTLGNFDGVHLGHQAIFRRVVERAGEISGTSVAFTFEPHPLKVLAPERSPRLLNTFHGKMKLLEAFGIDVVICADFTKEFAEQHPDDFARDVLHGKIGAREIYVGYDYAFGRGREGSIEFLKKIGGYYGFAVGVIEPVRVDGVVVSSSAVRDLVSAGRVDDAAKLLGRFYSIEGDVVHGAHRGRKLGFPTANISTPNELIPAYGVYAVHVDAGGSGLAGVCSIGVRPTFNSASFSIEVYIFDFDQDLYGRQLQISFIKRLRGEEKFPDAESLIRQIRSDVEDAKVAIRNAIY